MDANQAAQGEYLNALGNAVNRAAALAATCAELETRNKSLLEQCEKQAQQIAELTKKKAKKVKDAKPALAAVG